MATFGFVAILLLRLDSVRNFCPFRTHERRCDMKFLTLQAVFLVLVAVGSESVWADGFRTWKSHDNQHSVNAKFDRYEPDSGDVTIVDRDGEAITVQLDELSVGDQKLVVRLHKKMESQKKSSDNPFKRNQGNSKKKPQEDRKRVRTVARWGIEWTPQLKNAQVAALGRSRSSDDDRPIMWFRVLGDLGGYM